MKLSFSSRKKKEVETIACPSCNRDIPRGERRCPYCGAEIGAETLKASDLLKILRESLSMRISYPAILKDDGVRGETLETYRVGMARVRIAVEGSGELAKTLYLVTEPPMTPRQQLAYATILYKMYTEAPPPSLTPLKRGGRRGEEEEENEVVQHCNKVIKDVAGRLGLSRDQVAIVDYYVKRELVNFGVLTTPMLDPDVEDVTCPAPSKQIHVVHKRYSDRLYLETNIGFSGDDEVTDFMLRHAHKVGAGLTLAKPYADFVLQDGSRFAGIIGGELTAEGPTFTIRRFPENPYSLPQLVRNRMLSPLMASYMWLALEARAIFGVAGPTGSGKTTLFSALLSCLDPRAKLITIEDTFEIRIPHENWTRMTTRRAAALVSKELEVQESELIDMAMRMRPNYLIVGEVRKDDSVYHLLKAAFSGHGGGFTFHAGSANEFYSRLELMLNKTGVSETMLSFLWGCAITDHVETMDGRARRVIEIAEFVPRAGRIDVERVFEWRPGDDSFYPSTAAEVVERSGKIADALGGKDRAIRELERRERLLGKAAEDDMDAREFASLVAAEVYAK